MSGKPGGKFMKGHVCLFNSNRHWECSNKPPVSPNHACPETSRTWRMCWNSQNRHYSRNVGWWLLQYGCVGHSSVCLHALVLINTHSGCVTLSVGTYRSPQVMKSIPLFSDMVFSSLVGQCFFLSLSVSLSLSVQCSICFIGVADKKIYVVKAFDKNDINLIR